ncbi:MAG: polysaccharide biosynthesis protein, partial [Paracoccaceae bacterium]
GHVAGAERDGARQAALGGPAGGRTLSAALRAAGGIRPDADLSRVALERGGRTRIFDLNGAFSGGAFEDAVMVAGDRVSVPSRGCFQVALMRPNPVSPPGITVHMSNLTQPARANAPSAIGQHVREMPYGARFLQAVFSMNCMGGAAATNADRYAVLFSRNPVTGHSVVVERRLEDLLRRADRDALDPYLLPGDAVACYDSAVTNLTEVARAIGTIAATGFLVSL